MGVVARRNGADHSSAHLNGFELSASSRPLLICFSQLRWDFVYQRPQQLLSRAAKTLDILFVEEPIFESGPAELRCSPRGPGVTVAVPVLTHGTPEGQIISRQRWLLAQRLSGEAGARAIVLWYYTPMAFGFSSEIASDLVVYDNMDELSAFLGAPRQLLDLEKALFARADLVFTGGHSLYEAKRSRHPSVHAFPSSIDAPHFAVARNHAMPDPADQAAIPHPRLGYFGVIDERMNIDLVEATAKLRPDWQFVMLGPVVKIDPATLPGLPNIHWIGMKSYDELPAYLSGWDVGWMPFALNASTAFISPTKTPEFLAAGLPVISTSIADVVTPYGRDGLVEIADSAGQTEQSAEKLLGRSAPVRDAWRAKVDAFLAGNSWDDTWARMKAMMDDVMRKPPASERGARKASAEEGVLSV